MDNFLKKATEYGLYLLVFLLPWQARWMFSEVYVDNIYIEYWSKSLYIFDLLLILVLFLAGVLYLRNFKKLTLAHPKTWFFLAVFDLLVFVSIFISLDSWLSFYKYLVFLAGVSLFALIAYFPLDKTKILISFLAASFIQALIALKQFFTQVSPANEYLGMALHDPTDLGTSVVEAMGSLGFVERWLRGYGSLDHPNMLGAYLALACLVAVMFLVQKSRRHHLEDDAYSRAKIFRLNMNFFLPILVFSAGILVSFSRAAWLSFIFSLAFYLFIQIFKKDLISQKYFAPILFYIVLLIFLANIPFNNIIESRIKGSGRLDFMSNKERVESTISSKDIIKENIWLGSGIGTYTHELKEDYSDLSTYKLQPVHNTYLLILAEIGIFALLAFLAFLVFYFKEFLSRISPLYKIPFFFLFLSLLFFDHWWWSLHFGVLLMFMILAVFYRVFSIDSEK